MSCTYRWHDVVHHACNRREHVTEHRHHVCSCGAQAVVPEGATMAEVLAAHEEGERGA